jgi:hypothetical protein
MVEAVRFEEAFGGRNGSDFWEFGITLTGLFGPKYSPFPLERTIH